MLGYLKFLKRGKAPSESSEDDFVSNDEESDDPIDVFNKPVAFQQWGTEIVVSYHFLSVRDVAPHLSSWCFNRKIDQQHKDSIKSALKATEQPHLMGAIQVIRDRRLKTRILNGQHRIKAIQELIAEDLEMEFQMRLMFEVYDIDIEDIDDLDSSHTLIEKMFKIANNSLNMAPEQDHDLYCKRLVMAMMSDPLLKKGIVDKTNGTVNKPRISAKHLFELLKSFYPVEECGADVNDVITKIKRINAEISSMPFIKLFGRNTPAQQKIKQFDKAKELGFYLNLNGKMSPEVWIEMLAG